MGISNNQKLHTLMYTLLYPAVLGTMIVGLVFSFTEKRIDFGYSFFFAVFLVLYFSSQHVENATYEGSYSIPRFFLDIIEAASIFGLFLLLDVYKFSYSVSNGCTGQDAWKWFYGVLIVAFLIPVLSRAIEIKCIFEAGNGRGQSILSISASLITCYGFIDNESTLILTGLSIIFIAYLIFFVFGVRIPWYASKQGGEGDPA